jgi:hypothetical protein
LWGGQYHFCGFVIDFCGIIEMECLEIREMGGLSEKLGDLRGHFAIEVQAFQIAEPGRLENGRLVLCLEFEADRLVEEQMGWIRPEVLRQLFGESSQIAAQQFCYGLRKARTLPLFDGQCPQLFIDDLLVFSVYVICGDFGERADRIIGVGLHVVECQVFVIIPRHGAQIFREGL